MSRDMMSAFELYQPDTVEGAVELLARFGEEGWALAGGIPADQHGHWWTAMARAAMRVTDAPMARLVWIVSLVAGSGLFIWAFTPKVDYLPVAQTDLIWNNFRPPPGGNNETVQNEIAPMIGINAKRNTITPSANDTGSPAPQATTPITIESNTADANVTLV